MALCQDLNKLPIAAIPSKCDLAKEAPAHKSNPKFIALGQEKLCSIQGCQEQLTVPEIRLGNDSVKAFYVVQFSS